MKDKYKERVQLLGVKKGQIIIALLLMFDYMTAVQSYGIGLLLRFDMKITGIDAHYLQNFRSFIFIYGVICLGVYAVFRLYHRLWRYASLSELFSCMVANVVCLLVHVTIVSLFYGSMPLSYYAIGFTAQTGIMIFCRFSYRVFLYIRKKSYSSKTDNVMIIGAGSAGQSIIRDINTHHADIQQVKCIIDDNANKIGCYMNGIPVVGNSSEIMSAVKRYDIDIIIFAIPSADSKTRREILGVCSETGCVLKQVAPIYAAAGVSVDSSHVTGVELEDLLGRKSIKVQMGEVYEFICGKTILVTGGGGSIGSELCRQVAAHKPKQLIIFDIYENNAYNIQLELREKYPELDLVTLIGSVRDSRRLDQVFSTYRPELVFHAAAHKHVPLMEDSPCESIKNNVMGTYKTAHAAMRYGCRRFVLVSTDKAVNPTNIMGASKRLCEMVVQSFDRIIKAGKAGGIPSLCEHDGSFPVDNVPQTEFVAVRFGNVLGSNGSVVPLFKRQIEKGGPVTVTHPDIIRYFMTIPEAVSLILQAGTFARGGEIYVLDMGEPVKIDTLARNLIRLYGLRPDIDIPVVYSGLRPGEKLYEEKLMSEEGLQKTSNDLIFVGNPLQFDEDKFIDDVSKLNDAAYRNDEEIRTLVAEIVPTYKPTEKKQTSAVS